MTEAEKVKVVETENGTTYFFFEENGKKFFRRRIPSFLQDLCFKGEIYRESIENGIIHLSYSNATPLSEDRNIYVLETDKITRTVYI